jgi:hypothetical protein
VSGSHVSAALRRAVSARAERCCEYCLIPEDDTFFGCEVDHIISEKHGGATSSGNLAFACLVCNRRKGSDIASIDPQSGALTRLFNPRLDRWPDHFAFSDDGIVIDALTPIGAVTVRLLQLNDAERQLERAALRAIGRYPPHPSR